MTVEEVFQLVGDRPLACHAGAVFFTVYDAASAGEWEERGARVAWRDSHGGRFAEVHLAALLDPPTETDEEGSVIDNRAAILAAELVARRGSRKPPHLLTSGGA